MPERRRFAPRARLLAAFAKVQHDAENQSSNTPNKSPYEQDSAA